MAWDPQKGLGWPWIQEPPNMSRCLNFSKYGMSSRLISSTPESESRLLGCKDMTIFFVISSRCFKRRVGLLFWDWEQEWCLAIKVGSWKRVNHDLFMHFKRNIDFTRSLLRISSNKCCGRYDLELDLSISLSNLHSGGRHNCFFFSH